MREDTLFPVRQLSARKTTRFRWTPDAAVRAALAAELSLLDLTALTFVGEIAPAGHGDFALEGRLDAVVVQPCSISLAPVTTALSEPVARRYIKDWQEPDGEEVEVPEDDSTEPMPEAIDLSAVAAEALALALPLYPRAPGAELGEVTVAPPGAVPLDEAALKPFAALAGLRGKLVDGGGEGS